MYGNSEEPQFSTRELFSCLIPYILIILKGVT